MTTAITKEPNRAKQTRYACSHERLKLALEHEFYIEAAMICESIISDRLHSHLHWRVELAKVTTWEEFYSQLASKKRYKKRPPEITLDDSASLFILIEAVRMNFDDYGNKDYYKLLSRVEKWRLQRNKLAHRIAYTVPNKKVYEEDFDSFMTSAKECAQEGRKLVRLVSNWERMARDRLRPNDLQRPDKGVT